MSLYRTRPRLYISHGPKDVLDTTPTLPDLKLNAPSPPPLPNSPPVFPNTSDSCQVLRIGQYLLVEQLDSSNLYKAVKTDTQEHLICKVFTLGKYQEALAAYFRLDSEAGINHVVEILLGEQNAYVFFEGNHGDLHSYVRSHRRLRENEAALLFCQIATIVAACHSRGVVLRDLKLRKFVFKDEERTSLKLDSLDDAWVLDEEDDMLSDKHGCPAYASPEILNSTSSYSGKGADVWSLGVMLFTMLIGRYPFHDTEPTKLFSKIRKGQYTIPDTVSSRAKSLIHSLMRREPAQRLSAEEVLEHPWFNNRHSFSLPRMDKDAKDVEQLVPREIVSDDDWFT